MKEFNHLTRGKFADELKKYILTSSNKKRIVIILRQVLYKRDKPYDYYTEIHETPRSWLPDEANEWLKNKDGDYYTSDGPLRNTKA